MLFCCCGSAIVAAVICVDSVVGVVHMVLVVGVLLFVVVTGMLTCGVAGIVGVGW